MAEEGGSASVTTSQHERKEQEEEEEEEDEKGRRNTTTTTMSPWEQHSAVINLPRFDYNAPSSLLINSHSGFLITCTIKREKSATKEVMSILHKFAGPFTSSGNDSLKNAEENIASKKRRISTGDAGEECLDIEESESAVANSGDGQLSNGSKEETGTVGVPGLSLVKLTRSGLLLFTFPKNTSPNTVATLSNIIQALESGSVNLPVWCHRILPIEATCGLDEKELKEVVSKLVKKFVNDKQNKFERPLKFAVGYNRRGIEETKFVREKSKGSNAFSLLDRNKCFGAVASAVNDVVGGESVVDLRSPDLCVLVEVLPLSGVPSGSIIVAVSVLPRNLVSTKPRLCVRALNCNTKEGSVAQ